MSVFVKLIRRFFNNQLKKTFLIYSGGRLLGVLISLALIPLFTRELPKHEFGIVGILWLIEPLLSRLINLGLDVAVSLKYFKLDHKTLSLYLHNTLCVITLFGLLITAIGVWQIQWVRFVIEENMSRTIFALLCVSILFSIYTRMTQSFLQLSGKAVQNVVMTILPNVFITVMTYVLIIYVNKSYTSYVMGMAIGNFICGVIGLVYLLKTYPIKYFTPSLIIIKNLLRVGLPVIPGTVGGIILASGDRYVIKYSLGLEAVAIYTYGYRFAEAIALSIFQPFQKALSPIILDKAAADFDGATKYHSDIILSSITFFPLLLAAFVIPFKDVMTLLGSTSYGDSYIIFLITLFGVLLFNVSQVCSFIINHLERTEYIMVIVLAGAAVNVGLNFWLVPKYGIVAAGFTTIISYFLMLYLTDYVMNLFVKEKVGITSIIYRLTPFFFYLAGVYYIDTAKTGYFDFQGYLIKTAFFIILLFSHWLLFAEVREGVNKYRLKLKEIMSQP